MTLLNFGHCSEAVRHLFLRKRCNKQSAGIVSRKTATWGCWALNIGPAALMRKWTHASLDAGRRPKAQLWAALLPFTRHGLRQLSSSQNSQNYFTEMLFIFINCLVRMTNLKSLFYTGLNPVFGVHSIIVHLFSQKPLHLEGTFLFVLLGSFPRPRSLQSGRCRAGWWAQPGSSSSGEAATQPRCIQAIYLKCQLYVG